MGSSACNTCSRSFATQSALQQHFQDSHSLVKIKKVKEIAKPYACTPCNRKFATQSALSAHERDTPSHYPFACQPCRRKFKARDDLEQHLRSAPVHLATPLDRFFRSFPSFKKYNPALSPAVSFRQLGDHMHWKRNTPESNNAWKRYQKALVEETELWFGPEDQINAWHTLCRAIGIENPPLTCKECAEAVRKIHVNIVDLLDWARNGQGQSVQVFPNLKALSKYSKDTGKIFAKEEIYDQEQNGNVVLRHLLRHIFSLRMSKRNRSV